MNIYQKIFYINLFFAPFLGGGMVIFLIIVFFDLQVDSPELIIGVVIYTIVWLLGHLFMIYEGWVED